MFKIGHFDKFKIFFSAEVFVLKGRQLQPAFKLLNYSVHCLSISVKTGNLIPGTLWEKSLKGLGSKMDFELWLTGMDRSRTK